MSSIGSSESVYLSESEFEGSLFLRFPITLTVEASATIIMAFHFCGIILAGIFTSFSLAIGEFSNTILKY